MAQLIVPNVGCRNSATLRRRVGVACRIRVCEVVAERKREVPSSWVSSLACMAVASWGVWRLVRAPSCPAKLSRPYPFRVRPAQT